MNIFSDSPNHWKDLQSKVANLLTQIGYDAEVEKSIQTVRETINVDVYAIKNYDQPQSKILCECKHWNTPVPKTVVHAFRTTIVDFGANYGIIISKRGFQKGAYEAAKYTNILLFNWHEFQEYFRNTWIVHRQFAISKATKPLYDYVSVGALVFFKSEISRLTKTEREIFNQFTEKHFNTAFYSMNHVYKNPSSDKFDFDNFQQILNAAKKDFQKDFSSYDEYYSFLLDKACEGIKEFDHLFKRQLRITE